MASRPHNFSAGPAILPLPVYERTAAAVRELKLPGDEALESKLSILEISHRSRSFSAVHAEAIELCHDVIGIPRTHKVLLLQGGASLQFCMLPMNLRQEGKPAAYVDTGAWSKKAITESKLLGPTEVIASSKDTTYDRIPALPGESAYASASYVHITSNNTIYGTQWQSLPALPAGVPLCVDMSSDIASRPMALERVGIGYAGAQKNLGPSGLAVVFVREDLVGRDPAAPVPTLLRYATHVEKNSLFNTPNTFGIFVLGEVLKWVKSEGGAEAVGRRNASKAGKLYDLLDSSSLFNGHAQKDSRSTMNVTWTLAGDEEQSKQHTDRFLKAAAAANLAGLKGHRSVGGCRASIYNALPEAAVDELCELMREFERTS